MIRNQIITFYSGVWNQPGIDSTADIFTFCENLKKKCLQLGVKIILNCTVQKLEKEDNEIVGVVARNISKGNYNRYPYNVMKIEI